ncbi:hypothetical protein D9615_005323 [Tricholomella constricta]|uniref:DH domain-containing protein n=1 Tax=Tricholomella constricta TaxID=117010 RepID=A0A8H5M1Q9_9AGAR|nr:hypothetical protein D9615_005323 [Tricholomella constricta]
MNQLALDHKPLPPPAQDHSLPSPPHNSSFNPPPPPPKSLDDHPHPPHLANLPSFNSFESGLALPLTPTTPVTPSSPSIPSPDAKPRKSNPLNDLIETEKTYVDQLTGIIRKVAAAWSRSNLPPPDLDAMFRSIEGVYKSNRSFHSKLKDIGGNPSSPKALGDLLMRWIDDLNGPYTNYCAKYRCGFDTWEPVQSNAKLANILTTFSSSNPPPTSATISHATLPPTWTLDDLFLLPKARLKYYKKLYGRLLKSTAPGKSDHKLLVGALETLDGLLGTLDSRSSIKVGEPLSLAPPAPSIQEAEEDIVIDLRTQSVIQQQQSTQNEDLRSSAGPALGSESSSARGSSVSGGERMSRETAMTSVSRTSSSTLSMPISDLERRLSTQRTLDIFTMKPKAVRLQMAPPSLTFTREMRLSTDVVIRFTPLSTGVEVVHTLGHIFLLSDLFLVSERMTPDDRSQHRSDGADMWLCYPPLAGKVLRVFELPDQPNAFKVTIMRKETLVLETESFEVRNSLMAHFKDCIEFSQSLPPPSKVAPPPVPSLNGFPRAPLERNASIPQSHSSPDSNHSPSLPTNRPSSPSRVQRHDSMGGSPRSQPPPFQNQDGRAAEGMSRLVLSPEAQIQQGAQRVPSMHDPLPGPMYPRTSSSAQQFPNGLPNGPMPMHGQQGPPFHNPSFGHQGPSRPGSGPPGPGPGPGMGPGGYPQHPPTGQYGPPPPFQQPFNPHQPYPSNRPGPYGLPPGVLPPNAYPPPRPPSELSFQGGMPGGVRKSTSTRSLASQYSHYEQNMAPPVPAFPGGHPPGHSFLPRSNSYSSLPAPQPRPLLPSLQPASRSVSMAEPSFDEPSPPGSPVEETPRQAGPVTSSVSAQMKCKVFLQQQHSQWKSLGSAKLKLYRQDPTNIKQLVVEADDKNKSILISTIVLTDGVERVGKTGVAIELSDKGARTGIIYMIQLRNEKSAGGLFDSLLQGSDRAARG